MDAPGLIEMKNNLPVVDLSRNHASQAPIERCPTGAIVWQWRAWDHLIQDYDPSKPDYGVVADHPEKIDINGDRLVETDRSEWGVYLNIAAIGSGEERVLTARN